jgi:hypothetical protein
VTFERWGSLSVDDHIDTERLATNILLYDRLVFPVMTEQGDRDERNYWKDKGWDPELQQQRLDELGDLAVERPWNAYHREMFRTRLDQLRAEQNDADKIDAKGITRFVLAQETAITKPAGVDGVTIVAAYNSAAELLKDFPVTDARDHLSAQAYLLSRRIAIPDVPRDVLLKKAIELSRDKEFTDARADLFDWQELAIARRWSPAETVARVSDMTNRYNRRVKEAAGDVRWKFAFTLYGIAVGFATAGPVGAGLGAAVSLLQFVKFDKRPDIQAGRAQPAAMFHDIDERLGMKLAGRPTH